MRIFTTIDELQRWLHEQRQENRTVGFVPTMGALHEGHLSLVRRAEVAGDVSLVSIFVNPTQFNDIEDLLRYPRTPEEDRTLLQKAGCKGLFMPEVSEIYPPGQDLRVPVQLRHLAKVMEGKFRPGHFEGVMMVVKRLLDIVQPDRLYMGQKDFQQLAVVREMLRQLGLPVELIACPTVREADGLALSSRNRRLSPEKRAAAPVIFQALLSARQAFQDGERLEVIRKRALHCLQQAGLRPEYFEVVDGHTLLPLSESERSGYVVACAAAWAGEVRLIDNMVLQEEHPC
jgi:pantoate--beta-alanine ligase